MKTAIEHLEEYLKWTGVIIERPYTRCILQEEINKAKEIEKEQIIEAMKIGVNCGLYNYRSGEDYYKRTYKKK